MEESADRNVFDTAVGLHLWLVFFLFLLLLSPFITIYLVLFFWEEMSCCTSRGMESCFKACRFGGNVPQRVAAPLMSLCLLLLCLYHSITVSNTGYFGGLGVLRVTLDSGCFRRMEH